jgi:hypothetical protein
VIALAGGSIGSVVTLAIGAVARYQKALGEIGEHDRLARERDEDLAQCVADDHLRLTRGWRRARPTAVAGPSGRSSRYRARPLQSAGLYAFAA